MQSHKLRQLIKSAPKRPGVYQYLDAAGKAIYIGKALNIKNRLASYVKTRDERIQKMIEEADRVLWKEADSDIEALIVESQLIKGQTPKFNVVMRDDKQYAYVAFSHNEYPRIWITHQKREVADYIGPFTEATGLRETLKFLRRLFPYCTCKQLHHVRCLNAHIGKCLGVCCLKPQAVGRRLGADSLELKAYRKNIRAIKDILTGKRVSLVKRLEKEMAVLADSERFEEAIVLRSKVDRIKRIFENATILRKLPPTADGSEQLALALKLPVVPVRLEGYDVSNIQGIYATGSMVLFRHGKPDKNGYRKFKIRTVVGANDTAMLKEVLTRRFRHQEWHYPDVIVLDGGKGQLNAARAVTPRGISLIALTKNDRHRGDHIFVTGRATGIPLSKLPETAKNLIVAVDAEAHRFAIQYYRRLHRRGLS